MPKPSIMYAGSDRFACQPLERMIEAGYVPDIVLTNPDKRSGRGRKLTPTLLRLYHNSMEFQHGHHYLLKMKMLLKRFNHTMLIYSYV